MSDEERRMNFNLNIEIKSAKANEVGRRLIEVGQKMADPKEDRHEHGTKRSEFLIELKKFMGKRGLPTHYANMVELSPVDYEAAETIVSTMGKLGVIDEKGLLKFALYEVSGGKKSVNEVKNWIESLVALTRFYNGQSVLTFIRQIVPSTVKKVEETPPEDLDQL